MGDALVAVDAGLFPGQQIAAMDLRRAARLLGEIHRDGGMTVSAFERIVRLEPRPFALGQFEPLLQKFRAGRNRAEDLAEHLVRSLHLARDLVGPIVRHMTIGAARAHARAVREMHRLHQLLIDVVVHFVAGGAELLGVGDFESGVEAAPEDNAADKAAQCQKAEAQMRARAADDPPEPDDDAP